MAANKQQRELTEIAGAVQTDDKDVDIDWDVQGVVHLRSRHAR